MNNDEQELMKKILITGASGFIGSFLVEACLKKGYEVYAGIRSTSSKKYLQDSRIIFFELDLSDEKKLAANFTNHHFDYIIHAAGLTKADNKEDYYKVNETGSNNLIKALIQSQRVPKKFILISSLASYGPADNHPTDQVELHHTPIPITTYGRSKLKAEQYLQNQKDFPYLIFRPTAVYGPKETDLFVFFNLINKRLEAYIGKKPQKLTFIYVKDLVQLLMNALDTDIENQSYFVTDGNTYSTQDLGVFSKKYLEKSTFKIHIPAGVIRTIAFISEKIMLPFGKYPTMNLEKVNELESLNWQCNIQPLIDDFGFAPKYDLEEGLKETIQWYQDNKWLK